MRRLVVVSLAVLLTLVPFTASAQDGCSGGNAIVLKSSRGSIVACDPLRQLDPNGKLSTVVSVKFESGQLDEISRQLTEIYGAPVTVEGRDGADTLAFVPVEMTDVPLWQVFDRVSDFGRVLVRGLDYDVIRALRAELDAGGISGSFQGVRLDDALTALSILTGRRITASKGGDATLTFAFERQTLRGLLKMMANEGHAKITLHRIG